MTIDPVQLPGDERPHPHHSMEWWYFVSHVKPTADPAHPGFTIAFVVLRARVVVDGSIGLRLFVDHRTGVRPALQATRVFDDVYQRHGGNGYRFDLIPAIRRDVTWSIEASQSLHYRLRVHEHRRYTVELDVRPGVAYLLGNQGIVDYGQGVELAYYVRPHLPTTGLIAPDGGSPVEVSGHTWLERQWGDADYTAVRWKYLLIHASDAEQWIFFRLEHLHGARSRMNFGCRMTNGQIHTLPEAAIRIDDLPAGASPLPVRSRVEVPAYGIDLEVVPLFGTDQYYRPLVAPAFFEGASDVTGTIEGKPVACWGMTEMANY